MGFLQNFLKTGYRDGTPSGDVSSFRHLSEEQLEQHMSVSRYGDFTLTDAIRPAYSLEVIPRTGYRHECYTDEETGAKIPVLMASVSKEHLFDVFMSLLEPLGPVVDVVLETSHERAPGQHSDMYREQIDLPVLQSVLYDFEELLLNDGCCGLAVLNPNLPLEVQLDEHKLLFVYGRQNRACELALRQSQIPLIEDMRVITEAEHVHSSSNDLHDRFLELCCRLGIDI
ncbi:hypothetical protein LBMAG46_23830 [Planctomycetia bacterium]|nr:hypothetical protein LBMAG46_23830 [Planctomycetia bacterium]